MKRILLLGICAMTWQLQGMLDVGTKTNVPTPLMIAASEGDLKKAEELLKNGADINAVDKDGQPVIFYAIHPGFNNGKGGRGSIDMVKFLLENKADINAIDNGGFTALMIAVQLIRPDIVELLLERDADDSIVNASGKKAVDMEGIYHPGGTAARIEGNKKIKGMLLSHAAKKKSMPPAPPAPRPQTELSGISAGDAKRAASEAKPGTAGSGLEA